MTTPTHQQSGSTTAVRSHQLLGTLRAPEDTSSTGLGSFFPSRASPYGLEPGLLNNQTLTNTDTENSQLTICPGAYGDSTGNVRFPGHTDVGNGDLERIKKCHLISVLA